ncbi:MAG TPA: cytochrome c oxidase subunit 3, partial [Geobacteraceae bacterium]
CAAVFLFNKYLEWSDEIGRGIYPNSAQLAAGPPGESVFYSLYYLTVGLHGLHVLVGGTFLSVVAVRVKRGTVHAGDHVWLENGALYWHLVDLVWIFIFPLYYLIL